MPADVQVVSPRAAEASDGRIVLVAPQGTSRVRLEIDGERVSPRVIARRAVDDGVRFEIQTRAIDREGAELVISSLDSQGDPTSSARVSDVHLLGEGAFGAAATLKADARGSSRAAQLVGASGALSGVSVACYGSGKLAEAGEGTATRAGSTLKVAIVLAAMARREGDPSRSPSFGTYSSAIVASDNNSANQVISEAGGGDTEAGTQAVNDLMAELGMEDTVLDGPYVQIAGRSQKTTTATDLRLLADALLRTARDGSGELGDLGISQSEARVLIGLMSSAEYPGLVREHVPEPVAHKAGWLDDQQNDLALIFGGPGGTCTVGMVTEGLSFAAADALGEQVADEVLPLLAAPPAPDDDTAQAPATTRSDTAPTPTADTAPQAAPAPAGEGQPQTAPAAAASDDDDTLVPGPGWAWAAAIGIPLILICLAIARRIQVVRRRERRRQARRAGRG